MSDRPSPLACEHRLIWGMQDDVVYCSRCSVTFECHGIAAVTQARARAREVDDTLRKSEARADGTIRGLRFRLAEVEAERVPLAQCDRLHDLCERIMDALPDFDPGDALCGDLDDGVRLVVAQRELGRKREERLREALRTIVLEKTIYCDGYECSKPATYQDGDDRWCAECLEGAKKTAGKWGRKFKPVPFTQSWTVRVADDALDAAGDPP